MVPLISRYLRLCTHVCHKDPVRGGLLSVCGIWVVLAAVSLVSFSDAKWSEVVLCAGAVLLGATLWCVGGCIVRKDGHPEHTVIATLCVVTTSLTLLDMFASTHLFHHIAALPIIASIVPPVFLDALFALSCCLAVYDTFAKHRVLGTPEPPFVVMDLIQALLFVALVICIVGIHAERVKALEKRWRDKVRGMVDLTTYVSESVRKNEAEAAVRVLEMIGNGSELQPALLAMLTMPELSDFDVRKNIPEIFRRPSEIDPPQRTLGSRGSWHSTVHEIQALCDAFPERNLAQMHLDSFSFCRTQQTDSICVSTTPSSRGGSTNMSASVLSRNGKGKEKSSRRSVTFPHEKARLLVQTCVQRSGTALFVDIAESSARKEGTPRASSKGESQANSFLTLLAHALTEACAVIREYNGVVSEVRSSSITASWNTFSVVDVCHATVAVRCVHAIQARLSKIVGLSWYSCSVASGNITSYALNGSSARPICFGDPVDIVRELAAVAFTTSCPVVVTQATAGFVERIFPCKKVDVVCTSQVPSGVVTDSIYNPLPEGTESFELCAEFSRCFDMLVEGKYNDCSSAVRDYLAKKGCEDIQARRVDRLSLGAAAGKVDLPVPYFRDFVGWRDYESEAAFCDRSTLGSNTSAKTEASK